MKTSIPPLLFAFALVCFALIQNTRAVSPDGSYPGANTAEGQNALLQLTSTPPPSPTPGGGGTYNTAVGFFALKSTSGNSFNTGVGAGTLLANTADENTATGAGALLSNTTGFQNTADGVLALFSNTTGGPNTADGALALYSNTTGSYNTAMGYQALFSNTASIIGAGQYNTAIGDRALYSNTIGSSNTAMGYQTLYSNTASISGTGQYNTAIGDLALYSNTTGSSNTAIGDIAGNNHSDGDYNIYIGAGVSGYSSESNTIHIGDNLPNTPGGSACYIGGISGQTVSGTAVFIDTSNGQLGTQTSSERFKDEIKPMGEASESILALQPVTFRYKKGLDPKRKRQFGLVAEDVEKVSPDLVVRDKEGKPYSVRYDQVNAMLLNEFLKEHRKVEQLTKDFESKLAQQQKQIETLSAGLQKVSAQLEASKPASQVVNNP